MLGIVPAGTGGQGLTPVNPLHDKEREYILKHISEGPGAIAHALNTDPDLRQFNGGERRRNTVEVFIYREKKKEREVLQIEIPVHVAKEAREKGITPDQMQFYALRAILQRVKTLGISGRT